MSTYLVTYEGAHNTLSGPVTASSKEQAIACARKAWGVCAGGVWTAEALEEVAA